MRMGGLGVVDGEKWVKRGEDRFALVMVVCELFMYVFYELMMSVSVCVWCVAMRCLCVTHIARILLDAKYVGEESSFF